MVWIILAVSILTLGVLKYPYIDENNNISERRFYKSRSFPELLASGLFGLIILNVILFKNPLSIIGTIFYLSCFVWFITIMNYFFKQLLKLTQ